MKKLIITNLLFLFTLYANAQVYRVEKQLSPGTTTENSLTFFKSLKGKLYYLDQRSIYKYEKGIQIKYPRCPKVTFFSQFDSVIINDLEEFQGNIYVSAYSLFKIGTDSFGICFFDGTNWKPLVASKNMQVNNLCASGNFLYLNDHNGHIYKLDAAGKITQIKKKLPTHLTYYKPIPYRKTEIVFSDANHIYKYNGTSLDSMPNKLIGYNKEFISDHDSTIYLNDEKNIYKIGNTFALQYIDSFPDKNYLRMFGKIDNHLYFKYWTGKWNFMVYDLSANKYFDVRSIANIHQACSYNKIYTLTINYKQGETAKVYELTDGVLVEGKIFDDANKNCNKNPNETPKQKHKLSLINGSQSRLLITDDTGYFRTILLPGNYTIKFERKYIQSLYDSCGGDSVFSLGKSYNLSVPYRYNYPIKDIAIDFISELGFLGRRGFKERYSLVYQNFGSTTENPVLTLEYPDSVKYISSSVTPKSHVGRKLIFEINNLKTEESGKINLVFEIEAKKKLNSVVQFIAYTINNSGDVDTSNNLDTLRIRTVAAIDPNIKESYPSGFVNRPVSTINYHIQFQNEGNYYASRVVVVDTFDGKLPLTKLQMIGTKHPYSLRVENGNVLIWEFDNIKLMPKSMDDYGSRGYISFEVPLYKPLKIGETIKNRAHIYFDYEDPLATPFAIVGVGKDPNSTPDQHQKINGIKVFPNPAIDRVTIEGINALESIKIYSSTGELVHCENSTHKSVEISTQNWAKGLYLISLPNAGVSFRLLKL